MVMRRFFTEQGVTLAISGVIFLLTSLSVAVPVGAVSIPASTVWGIMANKVSAGLIDPVWSQGREAIV